MHAGVEGGGAGVRGAGGGACWHESAKLSITMGPPTKKDGGCDSLAGNWKSICEQRQTGVRRALCRDASHMTATRPVTPGCRGSGRAAAAERGVC